MMKLNGSHFDHDSSKISTETNQLKCTLTRPISTDESSEDDHDDDDMFPLENEPKDGLTEMEHEMPISEFYTSVAYGFQLENKYKHEKTNADIMAVVYNSRLRGFVILDTRGIVTCKLNRIGLKVDRVLLYPKYEHRVITMLQYVKKYNCYFVLDKEFIVKVLNKDFEEVYSMDSETIGASFMVFNSVTDELFTGGVGGTKTWQFHKISAEMFTEIKHLSNYRLTQKTTLPMVGGSWVQKIQVNPTMKHLYCCSEMSIHVYDMTGKLLYYFEQAHTMTITGCCYCYKTKVFATSSLDATVKVWGLNGSLLHTFRGHSKPISNLILHPNNPLLLISSSFDGTIKIWSLETLDQIYGLPIYASVGPMWMFLTDENMIAVFNPQEIKLWSLNHFINFWNLTRCQIFHMSLQSGGPQKSTRLMAIGTDSSLRLFSKTNGKKLCTVLPPPCVSPLERLHDFCYSRELNLVYLLLNPDTIWIYTSRTDPACRLAKWDTRDLQKKEETTLNSIKKFSGPPFECWVGDAFQCTSICILTSPIVMATDAGQSCPDRQEFLLLGLEDGRVLFMDLIIKGLKYLELKASKDAITALYHDKLTDTLVTKCRLTDRTLFKIWSLPHLHLWFNIPCALNLTSWTRLGLTLLTGYKDGHLSWHKLNQAEDNGSPNPKMYTELEPDLKRGQKPAHQAEILNVDACLARLVLCSCSSDGNIKIWETSGTLIREIILDDSLGSICFLNEFGDLLVSFQNHIFCIPHSKVLPHSLPTTFETSTSSAEESDIYEDPSITSEGLITSREETQGMKSYLVPYQMDFSKYFLPGKLSQMIAEVTQEKKDIRKVEKLIEKVEPLEENVEAAPEHKSTYLPEKTHSKTSSPTSFQSDTEKLDSVRELDYPIVNTSSDQNHSSQPSKSDSPIEEIIKDQVMDFKEHKKEISPGCTEISESQNLHDVSKRSHFLDATQESVLPMINSTISKESPTNPEKDNSKDIHPDLFAARPRLQDIKIDALSLVKSTYTPIFSQNKEESSTRSSIKESNTSQTIKKNPVTRKKKTRKNFVPRLRKRVKEFQVKTDCEAVVLTTETNPEMPSLPTSEEEYSAQKISSAGRTFNEEPDAPAINKLQGTQAINNSQMPNDSCGDRRRPLTSREKENERSTDGNAESRELKQKELETENEASQSPKDLCVEITKSKIVARTKGKNSQKKKLGPYPEDDTNSISKQRPEDSLELKHVPMTVKIPHHQSEDQGHKENEASQPPKDPCVEMNKSKIVTRTKGKNSLKPSQKKHSLYPEDDTNSIHTQESDESREVKYLPMTVKISPHRSELQVDKENEALQPPIQDPKMTKSKIVTRTKGKNSLEPGQKKHSLYPEDDTNSISRHESDESPEVKYSPMTVNISPHRSELQVDKAVKKESCPQSKSNSAHHHSRYKHSQTTQTEFEIRLDKFATRFSRGNNTNISSLLHGRDENEFGEDWCEKQIERHHLRHMQRNLRLKTAERQRQMSTEKKMNHKRVYSEKSLKIVETSQADNKTPVRGISEDGKTVYSKGGQFSNQETIHRLTHLINFPESKDSVIFKKGKGFRNEQNSRCRSAPDFSSRYKSDNKGCNNNVLCSTEGKNPTHLSDEQQCPNSEMPEPRMSTLHEPTLGEQELVTNYRLSLNKSQKTSPRRPRTSCSQLSDRTRRYHLNNTSFTRTKSIPENPKPCKMIAFGDNEIPQYRFPSPLEVRLLNKRFPQMCSRIAYHHFTRPYQSTKRIASAPSGKSFLTQRS